MSIKSSVKKQLITDYAINEKDTGSVEVQCAILTTRIKNLTNHLKDNHKDFSSRRGLLMLVGQRTRLLRYLANKSAQRYTKLIERLGIRNKFIV